MTLPGNFNYNFAAMEKKPVNGRSLSRLAKCKNRVWSPLRTSVLAIFGTIMFWNFFVHPPSGLTTPWKIFGSPFLSTQIETRDSSGQLEVFQVHPPVHDSEESSDCLQLMEHSFGFSYGHPFVGMESVTNTLRYASLHLILITD